MIENENETSILEHLFEVERNATTIITAAQDEASAKLTAARASAEEKFKSQFSEINKILENDFEEKRKELLEKSKNEIETFKERINASVKDEASFNKFLDKVLFA